MNEQAEIRYYLGIDAGGTKTEFLLTDEAGNEIKRVILGSANPVNVGIEKTKVILRTGISLACEEKNLSQVSVFAGLAGGISGNNKELVNEFLSSFGFGFCANGSDTDNALEAALHGSNGAVVIIGTGIVGFSQKNSVRHRVGGWGYMIDKGGSGFAIGSDVLDSAFRAFDGRSDSSLLLSLVEKKTGKFMSDIISDIYSGGITEVAAFAPIAFEAYEKGDSSAAEILDKNAFEIALIIRACCDDLDENDRKIVLCGGLCNQKEILGPLISKHLGDGYDVEFLHEPMVSGAVSLAMKNGGKPC